MHTRRRVPNPPGWHDRHGRNSEALRKLPNNCSPRAPPRHLRDPGDPRELRARPKAAGRFWPVRALVWPMLTNIGPNQANSWIRRDRHAWMEIDASVCGCRPDSGGNRFTELGSTSVDLATDFWTNWATATWSNLGSEVAACLSRSAPTKLRQGLARIGATSTDLPETSPKLAQGRPKLAEFGPSRLKRAGGEVPRLPRARTLRRGSGNDVHLRALACAILKRTPTCIGSMR